MPYSAIAELPDNIQADYTPDEQAAYLRVFNAVYSQTQDELKAHLAAMGAIKKLRLKGVQVMRRASNGDPVVGGWAMYFSNNPQDLDSYDTYFATVSKLMLDYYLHAPLWWEHGQDNDYGIDPIGQRQITSIYRHGVFLEHNLHSNHFRIKDTQAAVDNGEAGYSSDSIQHYVERGFNAVNGRMDVWPFAGCSLTRNPAELALGPVVSIRSFATALRSLTPPKPEAREAQGRRSFYFVQLPPSKGANLMDPAQLAALAEFLGCEATPEAVAQALQALLTQLQGSDPATQPPPADMAAMAGALGLPATAGKSEIIEAFQAIQQMLTPEEDPKGKKLKLTGLKRFTALTQAEADDTPEEDDLPHFSGFEAEDEDEDDERPARRSEKRDRRVGFRHNRNSPRPGLLDMIGAITQLQGGSFQMDMPAFKSRGTGARAALRAMQITNGPSGGWYLNREMSQEILEALYADLVFEQLGVQVVPMDGIESLTMNRVQSGASASWAGTGQTVTPANGVIKAAVTLQLRELVAEAVYQNKWLANGGERAQQMVEDDIIKVMRRKKEYGYLYGTGSVTTGNSGAEPLGLYNTTGVTKTSLSSANPKLSDLIDAEGRIEDTNLEYTDLMWLSSKRARRYFKKMKAPNSSQPLFSEDWINNDIRALIVQDHPFITTTQVPNTTANDVTTTDLFLGAWENALIGQGQDLEMVVDTSIYVRERNTLIQIVDYSDFGVAYKEGFEILTDMKV